MHNIHKVVLSLPHPSSNQNLVFRNIGQFEDVELRQTNNKETSLFYR